MSTSSHDHRLDTLADERSLERRRWFEHAIVFPVSVGMVAASVLSVGRDVMVHLGGQAWASNGLPDWALFALSCAIALGALGLVRR